MNTEQVVAVLKSAGLNSEIDTRRTTRVGFCVRQFGAQDVGVTSNTLSAEQWQAAMRALEVAGYAFTYRYDEGMGARVTDAAGL